MIKIRDVGKITDAELPLFACDNANLKNLPVSNDEKAPITADLFCLESEEPIIETKAH